MSRNLGALNLLDPSGPAWPVMGGLYLYLLLYGGGWSTPHLGRITSGKDTLYSLYRPSQIEHCIFITKRDDMLQGDN
jgi:hypothetical protein